MIDGSKTKDILEVQTIEAGFSVSFFAIDGQLYSCGSTGMSLQKSKVEAPKKVSGFTETVAQIESGPVYAAVITDQGALFMWGDNKCA